MFLFPFRKHGVCVLSLSLPAWGSTIARVASQVLPVKVQESNMVIDSLNSLDFIEDVLVS